VTDTAERTIVEAVYGTYIGMARIRIDRINRAAGGARVVEMWVLTTSYSSRMRRMYCANCEPSWQHCNIALIVSDPRATPEMIVGEKLP